jgi:GDSL-like Lipase/Acylhydrolase family
MRWSRRIVGGPAALLLGVCLLLGACGPAPAATAIRATGTPVPTAAATVVARPPTPVFGAFDPASVSSLKLDDYPVIPTISANAHTIYQAGLARGNQARVFSKLGDCMTENPFFLVTFSQGQYDLGQYADLQSVLDYYKGVPARSGQGWDKDSFATAGLAAASGFNVAAPLDATWADPKWCQGGESPAACEYRVASPSVALIMFGTNDVGYTDAASYDYFLRTLISQTIDSGVLPLLSTFPTRPENPAKSLLLNQIVVQVAQDYDIPLINLNRALEPLPNNGVNPADTIHLSVPPDGRVDRFTAGDLQYGFTMRNLVTLQALAAVLKAVG